MAATLVEAYKRALECDPVSAFGGVIGVNRPIDRETGNRDGEAVRRSYRRAGIRPRPLEVFATKKNLRLVEVVRWSRSGC